MTDRWTCGPWGLVILYELGKVWRVTSIKILWTKQASLNQIRHSMGSQWSCWRSSVDVSGETEDCCITTLASLYALKTSRMLLWTTKQDGISIIKSRRDQSRSNRDGHSVIHRWTDLPKGAYVVETGLGCCLCVRSHSEAATQYHCRCGEQRIESFPMWVGQVDNATLL